MNEPFDFGEPQTPRETISTVAAALKELGAALNEQDTVTASIALDEAKRRLRILGVAYWHQLQQAAPSPAWPCRCPWCMTDGERDGFWAQKKSDTEDFGRWARSVLAKQTQLAVTEGASNEDSDPGPLRAVKP